MNKALIVEDHPGLLEVLTLQLEKMGFAVVSANTGMEGVTKAVEEKPQLILMDIMMPGMDGREATRRIRSNQETKDIPILVITALTKESQLRECIKAGCNNYIVKPFTPEKHSVWSSRASSSTFSKRLSNNRNSASQAKPLPWLIEPTLACCSND